MSSDLAKSFVLLGYFPKRCVPRHEAQAKGLGVNVAAEEVCSVSACLSTGPKGWLEKWRHNSYYFYDSEKIALEVIGDENEIYDVFAYRALPRRFHKDGERPFAFRHENVTPLPALYVRLGFDVVNCATECESMTQFGCSPLSCNGMDAEIEVNKHCLIDDFETALMTARRFGSERDGVEPGPYYLLEVYRRPHRE